MPMWPPGKRRAWGGGGGGIGGGGGGVPYFLPEHNQQGSTGDWQNYAVGAPYGTAGVVQAGQNFSSNPTSGSSHLDAMLYAGGQDAGSYPASAAGTPPVVTSPASFDGRSGANGPPNLGIACLYDALLCVINIFISIIFCMLINFNQNNQTITMFDAFGYVYSPT